MKTSEGGGIVGGNGLLGVSFEAISCPANLSSLHAFCMSVVNSHLHTFPRHDILPPLESKVREPIDLSLELLKPQPWQILPTI